MSEPPPYQDPIPEGLFDEMARKIRDELAAELVKALQPLAAKLCRCGGKGTSIGEGPTTVSPEYGCTGLWRRICEVCGAATRALPYGEARRAWEANDCPDTIIR